MSDPRLVFIEQGCSFQRAGAVRTQERLRESVDRMLAAVKVEPARPAGEKR